jgi:phage baseplate assembly protein W
VPSYYEHEDSVSWLTGDYVFDEETGELAAAHPTAQMIAMCLRTPKGRALRDPTYGMDTSRINTNAKTAKREAELAAREALSRWVTSGDIVLKRVEAKIEGTVLWYEIDFEDPRDPTTRTVRVGV